MTIKDFLASATLSAVEHIKCTVKSNNKSDYLKLKKIFDSKWFEAKNFDDTELDVCDFDWQSLERDRNWWWQLQALPFLNWFANSLELQSDAEIKRYFSMCLDSISCWVNKAKDNKKSPLVWHDHATAFRLRNLANWLLFCHSTGLPVGDDARTESLADLVVEHLDWLQEDNNYSKFTNHGFDQAMVALSIGLMFDREDFEPYRQQNRERLKEEVNFAFTEEGVHKENSPGYQKMMLGRLKQLKMLAQLDEQEISQMGECYIEKAESFLRAITLPNGYLPMIGDTRGGDTGLPYEQKEQIDVLDYSASGYVIVRGRDGFGKNFFVLLKSTHESNYHRHDDDMMIYLFYDDEVVLGDGGLYRHQEKDEARRYLRSPFAHNVPILDKVAIRNNMKLTGKPKISRLSSLYFELESSMFGECVKRRVRICGAPRLALVINDFSVEGSDVWTNFFIDRFVFLDVNDGVIKARFSGFNFCINYNSGAPFYIKSGGVLGSNLCVASSKYGELNNAISLALISSSVMLTFSA